MVKSGSVTAAATRLNVSKSVISKRVSDLGSALRVELFQRSPGSVKPTEVARSFYERIVPLIRGITQATEGGIPARPVGCELLPDIIWD